MENTRPGSFPLIGISSTLLKVESGSFMGCKRTAVCHAYIHAIQLAGGIPIVLPVIDDQTKILHQLEWLDGLLLSGGYDVCPLFYEEEPLVGLEEICPLRDAYEIELVQTARLLQKPIFGICRGLQLLNVALGGTLYQDIRTALPSANQHSQRADPDDAVQTIDLVAGTRLHQIMGESTITTNTFHHQAIKKLASDLHINARARDGIIEGVEGKTDLFLLGVQWHPEMMVIKHSSMLKLFQAFVEASSMQRRL